MREPCPSCTPVTLSGLNLVSREIITATGAVTMPVWEGRVAGSSYPLRWLAVAPDQIVGAPDGPGLGGDETLTPVDSWSPTAGSSVIRISFHGSPDVGPCATTYVPAVVESTDGVAIALRGVPRPTFASNHMTCSMNATSMTMDVPVPSPSGAVPPRRFLGRRGDAHRVGRSRRHSAGNHTPGACRLKGAGGVRTLHAGLMQQIADSVRLSDMKDCQGWVS